MNATQWVNFNAETAARVTGPIDVCAIVANGVWAEAEHLAIVAIFDNRELLAAYVVASALTGPHEHVAGDPYTRSFRKDSYLYNFNRKLEVGKMPVLLPLALAARIETIPLNPLPPSGAVSSDCSSFRGLTIKDKYSSLG